jgi:hypothetical protein
MSEPFRVGVSADPNLDVPGVMEPVLKELYDWITSFLHHTGWPGRMICTAATA